MKLKQTLIFENGDIQAVLPEDTRLIGFQLNLSPFHADLSLQYRAFTSEPAPPEMKNGGEYTGTNDRRRKMTGFALQLAGALADQYDIIYQAAFNDDSRSGEAENGTVCGVDEPSGESITRLWVRVVKKS